MREGAMVEVKWEGDWWNAKVLSVRGGLVHVFYDCGLIAQVIAFPLHLLVSCAISRGLACVGEAEVVKLGKVSCPVGATNIWTPSRC